MDLVIDPELEKLLPKADKQCDEGLEASLQETGGPIDPIIVWSGRNTIIDGHRRYRICKRLGLSFNVEELEFDNIEAVKTWMRMFQVDRRNLSPVERKYVRSQIAAKLIHAGANKKQAAVAVAEQAQVDERTGRRDVQLAEAMAKIEPAVKDKMVAAELPSLEFSLMAKIPPEQQAEVIEGISDRREMQRAIRATESLPMDNRDAKIPKTRKFAEGIRYANELLGKTLKLLTDLSRQADGDIDLKRCRAHLNDVSDILARWKQKVEQK